MKAQEDNAKTIIGQAERVSFPELHIRDIHARIDTGAKTSALWVSHIVEKDGILKAVFLGDGHQGYSGKEYVFDTYELRNVASSNGHIEQRYVVRLAIRLGGRRIRAWFTLADRSSQVYPVLVGRNILRGKYVVDVSQGDTLKEEERRRSHQIQASLTQKGEKS